MPLSEDLVHFWLPFTLPWIPVLVWLRPRIRLLILKNKKGNLPFLYQFAAAAAIAIPTVIAQDYIGTATGKLTVLANVSEISGKPLTKYYELKRYFIDKRHVLVYRRSAVSGKNNECLDFYIDVACQSAMQLY
jgi:rhomboid protease GluP